MSGKALSVLVVDDDRTSTYITRFAFEKSGVACDLVFKSTVEEALAYINSLEGGGPDLILLDLYMPALSGWDFLDRCRTESINRDGETAVVLLSNTVSHAERERAKAYPEVVDCVEKPLTAELVQWLSQRHFGER